VTTVSVEQAVEEHRGPMFGLAYRLLGSVADAEDAVQEAFLRLERHGVDGIDNVGGWLNRTTSRVCLDRLRAAKAERELYVGTWLPEPLDTGGDASTPVELAESLTMAFLVVLETLTPPERVAFVLHDVFGASYLDVAEVLDRSEEACRQLVSRSRRKVREGTPRFEADARRREEVAHRFMLASSTGDLEGLLEALAPAAVLRSDGGGKVPAARNVVEGAERVASFVAGLGSRAPADMQVEPRWCNASPGFVVRLGGGTVDSVWILDVSDDRVVGVNVVRNPDKLAHLTR
jgi:RNA polymerase sigma-70 factor, ECF subfamily